MQNRLSSFALMLRRRSLFFITIFQAAIIFASLCLAWLLRFDFSLPYSGLLLSSAPLLIVIRMAAIASFGLLHGWWRYVGLRDVVQIIKADVVGTAAFFIASRYLLGHYNFPRSVYVSEAFLTAGLLAGVRVLSRLMAEAVRQNEVQGKKVVVLGAGHAAQVILRELKQPCSGYKVVACLDDDKSKVGLNIQGAAVVGTIDELGKLFGDDSGCEVIIAIPSASSAQMRRIVDIAVAAGLRYRTMPRLTELLENDVVLSQIREVNLDDLLGREAVQLDVNAISHKIRGRVVMVTGAAGSIGSELCRQILKCSPAKLVCLDQNENGIFCLRSELLEMGTVHPRESELSFCVADVRDHDRLLRICTINRVQIIFHAAAYKHVPLMEDNVDEAVRNNVFSLMTLLDVAEQVGSTDFVLISSDKAVNPSSVMGATKRICELIVASKPPNGLRCSSVRFGNVLGSNGSVVPVFREQLRKNLPITITHPEVQRFFMTISEAVSLVLQAFAVGEHGDIMVLDMGEPIKILDLARNTIRLAGKTEADVQIKFTGLRPGEKLNEELFYAFEKCFRTSHPKIQKASGSSLSWSELMQQLRELQLAMDTAESDEIKRRIETIVPQFASSQDNNSVVYESREPQTAFPSRDSVSASRLLVYHREYLAFDEHFSNMTELEKWLESNTALSDDAIEALCKNGSVKSGSGVLTQSFTLSPVPRHHAGVSDSPDYKFQ
jgi:FlaA1/EpsC-like NDP-sugar epimerase